jgi:AcrR family transcriptional regulator
MSAAAPDQLTRKQREFQQREQLILDTAQQLLDAQGYAHLTMERIAEAVEYSKGTIYNHFSSKEDLVCSLCCRCVSNLIELFQRAASYDGSTRERFSAIGIAYSLHHQLYPLDAQNIQIVKSNAVREKLSEAKLHELNVLEQQVTGIALEVVREAIDCGDIPGNTGNADEIVFGFWSMHYGALLLAFSDIPLEQLGFSPVIRLLWNNSQKLLEAFGWQPLSQGIDTDALFEKLCSALFAEEICKINSVPNQGVLTRPGSDLKENHHG